MCVTDFYDIDVKTVITEFAHVQNMLHFFCKALFCSLRMNKVLNPWNCEKMYEA